MKISPLVLAFLLTACGNHYYSGPPSHNFDGKRFFNPERPMTNTFGSFLRWRMGLGAPHSSADSSPEVPRATWPTYAAPRGAAEGGFAKPATRVEGTKLVVTSIGHASFLVQTQGLNILLDPVMAERASPVGFAGPKRITPPGVKWEDLPRIDLILVSHNHYEHLCLPTLEKLVARDNPQLVVPLGNDTIITKAIPAAKVVAKDWGESVDISPQLKVSLEPMQHWSARGLNDRRMALWAAMVLQTPGGNIYWVGDSGYGEANGGAWFTEAGQKYPNLRLAILPIGAYEPRWFMNYGHMNPTESVKAFQQSQAAYAIGHHFGVFQLTNEGWQQPVDDLTQALAAANVSPAYFRPLWPGEVWEIPELPHANKAPKR
jgi:L-ascorbate metabolism protein UlaG (beta-lactamase superfamily)